MSTLKKRKKKTTQHVPPRGNKCKSWRPLMKAKLMERNEISNKQRLFAAVLSIKSAISIVYNTFNLFDTNNIPFTLNYDAIIYGIIERWNETALLKWDGIQDRNHILATISWEKYFHKSCNYIDQYKNTVNDKFSIPIFEECNTFNMQLAQHQYPHNSNLQQLLQLCLTYACIYSLLVSEIAFFQSRGKPIIINTALVKNPKIVRYLKNLDANIVIFKWKEDEMEQSANDKICGRVRLRCIAYIESALKKAFTQFHGRLPDINLDEFKISVKFDKEKRAKGYPQFDPTPTISGTYFNTEFYAKISRKQPLSTSASCNDNKSADDKDDDDDNVYMPRQINVPVNNSNYMEEYAVDRKSRHFQPVSNYGIRRSHFDRSDMRKNYIEANVRHIRNDLNMNMNVHGSDNGTAFLLKLRLENEALKREKHSLLQQLRGYNYNHNCNISHISNDISMNSMTSVSMEAQMTENSFQPSWSPVNGHTFPYQYHGW